MSALECGAILERVRIADEETELALAYLGAVSRDLRSLSSADLDAFMAGPSRRRPTYRNPALDGMFSGLETFGKAMSNTYGSSYLVDPGETWAEYLLRLKWAAGDSSAMQITQLGRTVLSELGREQISLDSDEPLHVLVEPTDPFAYVRVFASIASRSGGLLVDPYLEIEQVLDVLKVASIRRILTGSKKQQMHPLMSMALGRLENPPELRWIDASKLHDRFFLPDMGDILMLGSSLNSIAKRPGIVVQIKDAAAVDAVRTAYRAIWESATVIEPDASESA